MSGAARMSFDGGGGGGGDYATGDGLVDPSKIPTIDAQKVRDASLDLWLMGWNVEGDVESVSNEWAKLNTCYQAPEQQTVYTLMDPAVKAATTLQEKFTSASNALDTFAAALDAIVPTLNQIKTDATEFRKKALAASDSWTTDEGMCDENTKLINKIDNQMAEVSKAETACYNTILALIDHTKLKAATAVTGQQLQAATDLPWGHSVAYQPKDCADSAYHGVKDSVVGMVQGAGQLIGYDPATGEWGHGDVAKQAWLGMGKLALAVVVTSNPVLDLYSGVANATGHGDALTHFVGVQQHLVAATAGSFVGLDLNNKDIFHKWREDGVRTLFSSATNIGTFFIPGGDVGKVLELGEGAGKIAKVVGFAADMLPGGSKLLEMAGVGAMGTFDMLKGFGKGAKGLEVVDDLGALGKVGDAAASGAGHVGAGESVVAATAKGSGKVSDEAFGAALGGGRRVERRELAGGGYIEYELDSAGRTIVAKGEAGSTDMVFNRKFRDLAKLDAIDRRAFRASSEMKQSLLQSVLKRDSGHVISYKIAGSARDRVLGHGYDVTSVFGGNHADAANAVAKMRSAATVHPRTGTLLWDRAAENALSAADKQALDRLLNSENHLNMTAQLRSINRGPYASLFERGLTDPAHGDRSFTVDLYRNAQHSAPTHIGAQWENGHMTFYKLFNN